MIRYLCLAILWALPVSSVAGHDFKVFASRQSLPDGGGKSTVYLTWGHRLPVDELVDAGPIDRYDLVRPGRSTTQLKREGVSLQANSVDLREPGVYSAVVVRKPSIYTYVLSDEGQRQLKRGPKSEHPANRVESGTRYQVAGKAMIVVGRPGDEAPAAIGLPAEIIPLEGPVGWRANRDVRFRIVVDGQPVPFADVVARSVGFKPDDAWSYATESDRLGEFTIRPGQPGIWVVRVTAKKLAQGATRQQYDLESSTATLTLEIQP